MANRIFTLESGRPMSMPATGDPLAQRLVVLCLPTPGGGQFDPDPVITDSWGVRLVMLDRPGYGGTPAREGDDPTVEERADELAEFLRRTGPPVPPDEGNALDSAGAVGWGTGGMVALSLAARHPDLVNRVAVVNTAAPRRMAIVRDERTMLPFDRDALFIRPDDPALAKPGLGNRIDRLLDEAGRQGAAGLEEDRRMLADHRWAKELSRIQAEVVLVYGDDHPDVSMADGRWYRSRIPRARTARVPGGGALTIAERWGKILAHVAPRHGGLSQRTRWGGPHAPWEPSA